MLGVYTIVERPRHGWGSAHTLGLGAVALGLLAAFVAREAHARAPLVPLRIFRSRNVSGANVVQALMVAGMFGMFFLGRSTCSACWATTPSRSALAFLPVDARASGRSRCASRAPDHALRRRARAPAGLRADRRRAVLLHARAGRRRLRRDVLPRWSCSASAPGSPSPR
jgi:hypothetical protein